MHAEVVVVYYIKHSNIFSIPSGGTNLDIIPIPIHSFFLSIHQDAFNSSLVA